MNRYSRRGLGDAAGNWLEVLLNAKPSWKRAGLLAIGAVLMLAFQLSKMSGDPDPKNQGLEGLIIAAALGFGAMVECERLLTRQSREGKKRGGPDKGGHLPRVRGRY